METQQEPTEDQEGDERRRGPQRNRPSPRQTAQGFTEVVRRMRTKSRACEGGLLNANEEQSPS